MKLSILSLVSYDWQMTLDNLPSYYQYVDEIIFAIDKDGLTFTGENYSIPPRFFLHLPPRVRCFAMRGYGGGNTPLERETFMRRALSKLAKPGNLQLQIDADEEPLNLPTFIEWLATDEAQDARCIKARWRSVWKTIGDTALVVEESDANSIYVGFKESGFIYRGRQPGPGHFSPEAEKAAVLSPLVLLHRPWDRTDDAIKMKMRNWSHSDMWDTKRIYEILSTITLENYHTFTNFCPYEPHSKWPRFKAVPVSELRKV